MVVLERTKLDVNAYDAIVVLLKRMYTHYGVVFLGGYLGQRSGKRARQKVEGLKTGSVQVSQVTKVCQSVCVRKTLN